MNTTSKISSLKLFVLGIIQLAVFTACNSTDAPEPSISVSVSSSTVKVGEPVTFTIHQNTNNVTIYTGDSTHNFLNSAAYLLAGKSEQELKEALYRPYDSLGVVQKIDFSTVPDPTKASVVNVDKSGKFISSPTATLVVDTAKIGGNGKTVLKLAVSPKTGAPNQGIRLYPNMSLRQNRLCVIRLRYSSPNLLKTTDAGNSWSTITTGIVPNLKVATKITAYGVGDNATKSSLFSDALPTASIVPASLTSLVAGQYYQDLSFDLNLFIVDWEFIYKKTFGTLSGIQFLFYGTNSAAFEGNVYVESVTVAGKNMPFDLGQNIPVLDNSGVVSYKHTFSKPGTYNVTVLGTSFGGKRYSGNGYQTNRGDNITAGEYDVKYKNVTVPITVTP